MPNIYPLSCVDNAILCEAFPQELPEVPAPNFAIECNKPSPSLAPQRPGNQPPPQGGIGILAAAAREKRGTEKERVDGSDETRLRMGVGPLQPSGLWVFRGGHVRLPIDRFFGPLYPTVGVIYDETNAPHTRFLGNDLIL